MKKTDTKTLSKSVLFICVLILLLSACTQKNAKVWVASPWQKVMRSTPPGELQTVTLKAAANEYEPFRLIVSNTGKKLIKDVNVKVSNLKSTDGEILAENIKLYRANYVHVTKPSSRTKNLAGWYPDALIPFTAPQTGNVSEKVTYVAAPFVVDTAQNAEIWCDLYVPPGTKPGLYNGTVTVTVGKSKLIDIPVNLTVWGFELPGKIAMLSHFGGLNAEAGKMMGMTVGSKEFMEMEALYDQELLKNRAVPSTPSYAWPAWNEKEGIVDKGEGDRMKQLVENDHFNTLDIPFRYKEDAKKCKAYLAATAEWLKKLGYLDKSYIYMEDEPNDAKEYGIVRKQGAMIKAANPKISRMCTEQTLTQNKAWGTLYGAVDIWCPLWGLWDETTAKERMAKGERMWSYTALCQGPDGTPWWQIDVDPLNFRSPMWISWHYNIIGFLYWSSSYWNGYGSLQGVWEAPAFRKNYWGEGMLVYPGQPAGIKGFVPSVRLKLYRESAEDYEYMTLAKSLGKGDEVNKIVDGIATSFQKWSRDQSAYEQARESLANLILKGK
jgi:hypothetical protein